MSGVRTHLTTIGTYNIKKIRQGVGCLLFVVPDEEWKRKGKMTIESNYDVIRFIEHGNRCRPTMDRVSGELLIYVLREHPQTSKSMVFTWFRELAVQLEQYRRYRNNRGYRYVNPYSVLVTRDGEVLLLDLEAESNEFVMKSMQKRAMRKHFVKPIAGIKENIVLTYDLYGLGKTMQFILANTKLEPELKKSEERRLEKVISRCLGEDPKKQYNDLKQVLKDLPEEKQGIYKEWKKAACAALILLCLAAAFVMFFLKTSTLKRENQRLGEQLQTQEKELREMKNAELKKEAQQEESLTMQSRMDALAADVEALEEYTAEEAAGSSEDVIREGEILLRELYWYLAPAYEQEGTADRAIETYGSLCRLETEESLLERAYLKKAALELESGKTKSAEETLLEAAKQIPEIESAEEYSELMAQCSAEKETDSNAEAGNQTQGEIGLENEATSQMENGTEQVPESPAEEAETELPL